MQLGRRTRALGLVLGVSVLVAGCGVRGGLEYPETAAAPTDVSATADSAQGKPAGATGKPHRSSILDPLIR